MIIMAEKKQSEKERARMYFKRLKAGMGISHDELLLVKRYYPHMRNCEWD